MTWLKKGKIILPLSIVAVAMQVYWDPIRVSAQSPIRFTGPTSSQPLALTADDSLLIVANPDNNSVTLFDVKNANAKLVEIPVGKEPNGVAIAPDGLLGPVHTIKHCCYKMF
jgi:YVTN family beta-propeller protein